MKWPRHNCYSVQIPLFSQTHVVGTTLIVNGVPSPTTPMSTNSPEFFHPQRWTVHHETRPEGPTDSSTPNYNSRKCTSDHEESVSIEFPGLRTPNALYNIVGCPFEMHAYSRPNALLHCSVLSVNPQPPLEVSFANRITLAPLVVIARSGPRIR